MNQTLGGCCRVKALAAVLYGRYRCTHGFWLVGRDRAQARGSRWDGAGSV